MTSILRSLPFEIPDTSLYKTKKEWFCQVYRLPDQNEIGRGKGLSLFIPHRKNTDRHHCNLHNPIESKTELSSADPSHLSENFRFRKLHSKENGISPSSHKKKKIDLHSSMQMGL
jgi:hypothetical protein